MKRRPPSTGAGASGSGSGRRAPGPTTIYNDSDLTIEQVLAYRREELVGSNPPTDILYFETPEQMIKTLVEMPPRAKGDQRCLEIIYKKSKADSSYFVVAADSEMMRNGTPCPQVGKVNVHLEGMEEGGQAGLDFPTALQYVFAKLYTKNDEGKWPKQEKGEGGVVDLNAWFGGLSKKPYFQNSLRNKDGKRPASHDSLEYCLGTLKKLKANMKAAPEAFESVAPTSRKKLFEKIKNKPIPEIESGVCVLQGGADLDAFSPKFDLLYKPESKDAAAIKAFGKQVGGIQKWRKDFVLKHRKLSVRAEAPEYKPTGKDKYETKYSDGIINKVEMKKGGVVLIESELTDESVTSSEWYTKAAIDTRSSFGDSYKGPIVLDITEPSDPGEVEKCKQAYRDVFGEDKVFFKDEMFNAPSL